MKVQGPGQYADHLPLYRQAQIYTPAGHRARPFDARLMGWPRRMAFAARVRAAPETHQIVDEDLRRRVKLHCLILQSQQ